MQPPLPAEAVRELVCSCLHRDPVAADLRCSLFVAAAQSYKRDSLLRPFPPRYLRGDVKDFDELVRRKEKMVTVIQTLGGTSLPMRVFYDVDLGLYFGFSDSKRLDRTVFLATQPRWE